MKYLKIHLEASRMYFSAPHNTPNKELFISATCPTVNALVGMIGNSMNIARGHEMLEFMRNHLVFKYTNTNHYKSRVKMDLRTTRPLKGEHFATIGGAKNDSPQKKYIEFLQSAAFDVYIGADEETLRCIHHALLHPYRTLYIGRAECIPSKPFVNVDPEILNEEELPHVLNCP